MNKQVVIIGGGIIGLSAAAHCLSRGHRVTIIERNQEGCEGCSTGNAGMIVPSHFVPLAAPGMVQLGLKWMWNPRSPFYIRPRWDADLFEWAARFCRACTPAHVKRAAPLLRDLSLASREIYLREAESGEEFGLVRKGLLMLCKSARTLSEEAHMAGKARRLGIPAEVLDARQTADLEPGLTMDIAGAVYFPMDCHMSPQRYASAVARRVAATGGKFLFDSHVHGWRREGGHLRAVQTSRGEIGGDEFVLAGGAWSAEIVKDLPLRLLLQAGKGYSVTLASPVQRAQICSILTEARVAVTPMGNAMRFGGTMEIAGLDERINSTRVQGIINAVGRYFPRFTREQFEGIKPWVGLRPCSPDGLPYLGRTQAASNLIVATAHAMMGMSLAPVTGRIIGQLVDREPVGFNIKSLSPDRYA